MADEVLEVLFVGKDRLSGVMSSLTGSIQSNLQKAALGGAALLGGATALGVGAVKMAADFDAAMRNVNAIAQLPEEQFKSLQDQVLDFSLQTRASSTDIANSLYNIVSAGFDTESGFKVMEAASRAAGAGLADTESTSRLLIATLRSYNLPVEEASNVTDIFLQTVNQGITTLPELANGLGRIMPIASNLGVGLEELGFTVGQMTQSGLSTDEAMTRLQATFTQFLNPTTELQEAIESLGYASGYELVQSSGGALGALRELKDNGFLDTTEEAANLFSNVRALGGVMSIISNEATLAEGAVEAFGEKAGGAVERAREQQYKSFSANLAKLKSAFEAIAIKIGSAVLPALIEVLEIVVPIAREFGEKLKPVLEEVAKFAEVFGTEFGYLIENLREGENPISAITGFVWEMIAAFDETEQTATDVSLAVKSVLEGIVELKDRILEFIEPIVEWVINFVELKDVLMAIGVVIGITLIPIVISLITTLAPIILTVGAIILAVAFLRQVWENDFLGIRTRLEHFWLQVGEPIFTAIKEWLGVFIPQAIDFLKNAWENVLLPAIQAVWAWIDSTLIPFLGDVVHWYLNTYIPAAITVLKTAWEEVLLPAIQAVWEWISGTLIPFFRDTVVPWLQEKIPAAIETLKGFWEETLLPAIESVWAFIQDSLVPLFEALWELLEVAGATALTALQGIWENVLLPAIESVWEFIDENVIPIFESLWEWINDNIIPVIQDLRDKISEVLQPILETISGKFSDVSDSIGGISGAIESVIGWIGDLTENLRNIKLPDWMTPNSPTDWEIGLRGVSSAMRELNSLVPALDSRLLRTGHLVPAPIAGGPTSERPSGGTYNLNVYGDTQAAQVMREWEILQSLAGEQ